MFTAKTLQLRDHGMTGFDLFNETLKKIFFDKQVQAYQQYR